jgi:hypothetical protein
MREPKNGDRLIMTLSQPIMIDAVASANVLMAEFDTETAPAAKVVGYLNPDYTWAECTPRLVVSTERFVVAVVTLPPGE